MTTLDYEDLTLRAGSAPILDRIRLTIEGPGVFALLGPSGVGKSSLLRATQRLIDDGQAGWRRTGDVRFNGESIFASHVCKQELARLIGRQSGLPVRRLLARRSGDGRQTGRSRRERLEGPELGPPNGVAVAIRRAVSGLVTVVDDVATTGSSLRTAATDLRQMGASRVVGLVAAVTPLASGVAPSRLPTWK